MKCKHVVQVNFAFGKFKKDELVPVALDANGEVLDKFWRARLKDAEYDNCCVLVKGCLGTACNFNTKSMPAKKAGK